MKSEDVLTVGMVIGIALTLLIVYFLGDPKKNIIEYDEPKGSEMVCFFSSKAKHQTPRLDLIECRAIDSDKSDQVDSHQQ